MAHLVFLVTYIYICTYTCFFFTLLIVARNIVSIYIYIPGISDSPVFLHCLHSPGFSWKWRRGNLDLRSEVGGAELFFFLDLLTKTLRTE